METCLVTGGSGFIGSHLCDKLIENGYKVICLDNLITGSKRNIEHLLSNPNFKFVEADVCKAIDIAEPINYIFHLASPASPADFEKIPEEVLLANSLGGLSVLKLAEKTKAKLLMASTSEVYGDPMEHPQKETYWGNVNSFGPRSCYDESKRFAEAATYVYLKKYGIDVRMVRIFNTYGPRMRKDDGRVISNFINQAIEEKPLTVYGKGDHSRSFCFVSDLVEGIFKAMFADATCGEIINLGNPEEYKMLDLAQKIKKLTNSNSEIVFKEIPPDDPSRRQPDISKARRLLNWEPKITVDEGLQKTIEYYKSL